MTAISACSGARSSAAITRTIACALIVAVALAVAPAEAGAGPVVRWTKRPDDRYRCTRYAPGVSASDPLRVFAPPGKPMIFTMAARSSDRKPVTYRAHGLPPGATVDRKGKFAWTIPPDATGSWSITLIAESASGATATTSFTLAIADRDLIAAWNTGMGAFASDCTAYISAYEVRDIDADGLTDLIYTTGDQADDSASSDSYRTHIRRRIGARFSPPASPPGSTLAGRSAPAVPSGPGLPSGALGFDRVEREIPAAALRVVTLPDGKPAIVATKSCCCLADLWIYRVTATAIDELLHVDGTDCVSYEPVETETNATGQVHRVIARSGDDPPSVDRWVWRRGAFVQADR